MIDPARSVHPAAKAAEISRSDSAGAISAQPSTRQIRTGSDLDSSCAGGRSSALAQAGQDRGAIVDERDRYGQIDGYGCKEDAEQNETRPGQMHRRLWPGRLIEHRIAKDDPGQGWDHRGPGHSSCRQKRAIRVGPAIAVPKAPAGPLAVPPVKADMGNISMGKLAPIVGRSSDEDDLNCGFRMLPTQQAKDQRRSRGSGRWSWIVVLDCDVAPRRRDHVRLSPTGSQRRPP